MESWRKVWREGALPLITTENLEHLKKALENDDPRLIQGATTTPPPLQCVIDWPVESACLLAFPGVMDNGGFLKATVGNVEEHFARTCFAIDQALGEPAACRWLLNWFDESPREVVRKELLAEINRALANRRTGELSHGAIDVDVAPITGVDE